MKFVFTMLKLRHVVKKINIIIPLLSSSINEDPLIGKILSMLQFTVSPSVLAG